METLVLIFVLQKVGTTYNTSVYCDQLFFIILDYFSSFSSSNSFDVDISVVGYFSFRPNGEVWINPGDFLGFSGGKIGYR